MSETITTEEWLAELENLQGETREEQRPRGTFRSEEIREFLGWSRSWMAEKLRKAVRDGLIRCVKVRFTDIGGRNTWVTAYQLVKKETKNAKRKAN